MGFRRVFGAAFAGLVLMASAEAADLPAARWDQEPGGRAWTEAALEALEGPAAGLLSLEPEDVRDWCPGYEAAGHGERKAFWVGLVSALAKHESTWRADVSGGEGRWHGLLQISPATARLYGCEATRARDLKDGGRNLRCGLRILATTIARDGVIAAGGGGAAADWGPFSHPAKRDDMRAWTRSQAYCQE